MFINYFMTAFRNLVKYKGFSFINIVGLGFGMASCLLILLFVQDEISYDRFHLKSDRIYRVGFEAFLNNSAQMGATSCAPLAAALVQEYPEVETATRARNYGFPVFRYQEKVFSEEGVFWVDSTFFDVFTVPFIYGDPKTALTKPASIVLTRSSAAKYFGEKNPVGKTINSDNQRDYMVTGVVEDVPRNSHFHYDFLASLVSYPDGGELSWVSNNFFTYFVLKEGIAPGEMEIKINELLQKYAGPQIKSALGITMEQFLEGGGIYRYFLQSLTDIHLHSHLDIEIEANGNYTYVLIFSLVAFGILLVACINFINLATARSSNRTKEVGIRKTLGSTRGQLIRQFLLESVGLSFLAMIVALLLVNLAISSFNNMAGKQLEMAFFMDKTNILAILGLVLFIGLLAGTYPAFFLASFQPVSVMSGKQARLSRSSIMRNILVVFQFAVAIILIIGTLVVRRQMDFIRTTDLGFNKKDVIIIHKTDDLFERLVPFKLELLKNPNMASVSNVGTLMGEDFDNSIFLLAGKTGEESHLIWVLRTDPDFVKTFQIDMVEGRYFEKDRQADLQACVLNEAAVKVLGLEDPVGKEITGPGDNQNMRLKILGVMKDFHFESMHQKIRPLMVLIYQPDSRGRYLLARIQPGSTVAVLSAIETTWKKFADNQAFEYEFFDDHFSGIYLAEQKTAGILFSFSLITIIIASMGLFGLAAFIAEQRTKEIGVRKVMGATVVGILTLLIRQFTKWILIANLVAWPVAYIVIQKWLQNFVYQPPFSIWIFVISAILAFVVAVLTVSFQSVRAALANPVKSLRHE